MSDEAFLSLQMAAGAVSRETYERLCDFVGHFRRWSQRINLVAPSTIPHLWERHVLDSAQLVSLAPEARRWLDLGSGGGFPGAVIAILMSEHPEGRVDLVESNRKKAAFLQTILLTLDAPAHVHPERVENCYSLPAPEIVTARALAPLGRLFPLVEPWIGNGARAFFHKGRDYQREIEETGNAWRFDLVEHKSRFDGEGVVLEISNLQRT